MYKYIPIDKRSKKEQKTFNSINRKTWDGFKPAPRVIPSGKVYDRNKMKQFKYDY